MANVKIIDLRLRGTQFTVNSNKLQKKDGSLLGKVSALAVNAKKTEEKIAAEISKQTPAITHVNIDDDTILIEIDHTPHLFNFILDYYTHGNLHFPHGYCVTVIYRELEFWKLQESVLGACCWGVYQEQLEKRRLLEEEKLRKEQRDQLFKKCHEKLDSAIDSRDINLLKEAIEDFTLNDVPELDGNLTRAKVLLEKLETAQELLYKTCREKLAAAMASEDTSLLKEAIEDYMLNNVPEVGGNLTKAKELLEYLEREQLYTKCREKLASAMASQDIKLLKAAIEDYTLNNVPEVDGNLTNAQELLEDLERRLREKEAEKRQKQEELRALEAKYEEYRARLQAAMERQDAALLAQAIHDYEQEDVPEHKGNLTKAKKLLDFLTIRQELTDAMAKKDLVQLDEAIAKADNAVVDKKLDYPIKKVEKTEFGKKVSEAKKLREEIKEYHDKLASALASQDISLLREAIEDFTTNNIPEVDGNLTKAKELLAYLETLKEQVVKRCHENLAFAMESQDINLLKEAIEEFTLNNVPDEDGNLLKARVLLENLEAAYEQLINKCREKLISAIASEDINLLKEAIEDFLINNVPDEEGNLTKARELLEDLERRLREIEEEERQKQEELRALEAKYEKYREGLEAAMESEDVSRLAKAISHYERAGVPDPYLAKARRLLQLLTIRQELTDAMNKRNLAELEKAIAKAENAGIVKKLGQLMQMAYRIRDQLKRLEKLRHAILNLDQRTIAEIKSYDKPPAAVHTVMSATFILLGEPEKTLKDWRAVQILIGKIGKDSLKRRIQEFDLEKLKIEVAHKAKRAVDKFTLDETRDVSAGAGTFYVWSKGMIEESESHHRHKSVDASYGGAPTRKMTKK